MNIKTDINEALRYLGCKEYNKELAEECTQCINEINEIMTPRWAYGVFAICPENCGVKLLNTDIIFTSKDINKLLRCSEKCVIMAVTLGAAVDKRISFYQKTDMSKAVVFDACASATVEALCDYVTEIIKLKENVKYLTMRYSPGYGDFDISVQKKIIAVTDAYKRIGLTTTSSMLLTPTKSVTAVMGITNEPYMVSFGGCECCSNYNTCAFRKSGNTCKG